MCNTALTASCPSCYAVRYPAHADNAQWPSVRPAHATYLVLSEDSTVLLPEEPTAIQNDFKLRCTIATADVEEVVPLAAISFVSDGPAQASVPVRAVSAAAVMFSGGNWVAPSETAAETSSCSTGLGQPAQHSAAPEVCSISSADTTPAASAPTGVPLPASTPSAFASYAVQAYRPAPVASSQASSTARLSARDTHNSVTVKHDTKVKDAAGAITKVLDRTFSTIVTALRSEDSPAALHSMVKSLAVCGQYVKSAQPEFTVVFLPFNRTSGHSASNCEVLPSAAAVPDPSLFAALVYKTILRVALVMVDETELNVKGNSNINDMANAIISIILGRGQALMKLGGAKAMFVAISAVINARHRLQRKHNLDLMVTAEWFDEDTTAKLGHVSKFLRINVLQCPLNGPLEHTVRPFAPA